MEFLSDVQFWEKVAVVSAIGYVILAAREHIGCWFFALISTVLYTIIYWEVSLLMESALNVYYLGMAVYGWWQWQTVTTKHTVATIHQRSLKFHAVALAGILLATLISGLLLSNYSRAAIPYVDSFTTWAAVFGTWLVAKKVLENWWYWVVIDLISVFMNIHRELYWTAVLMAFYTGFAVYGWFEWRKKMLQTSAAA